MKKILLFTFLLIAGTSCSLMSTQEHNISIVTINTKQASIHINVEIAATNNQRQQGLMYRKTLPEQNGMLFIFPQKQIASFWMKNTLIPLDMIFISADLTIVHIEKDVPPCKKDPCAVYSSGTPVLYVLETNSGFTNTYTIQEGDSVTLPDNL